MDRLWLAVLALESDFPQPVDDMAAAAEESLRLGDLELSEQLGRAAVDRSPAAGHPADPGLRAGVAGPRPGRRRGARRGGSVDAVRDRADGVGAAAGGQPVLDAERAGARDGVPAYDARPGVDAGRADHGRRAVGDLRDERGEPQPGQADRRRGAGLAGGRRHGGGLGGVRGRTELGPDGPVRRGRRAGRAGDGRRPSRVCCGSPAASVRPPRC